MGGEGGAWEGSQGSGRQAWVLRRRLEKGSEHRKQSEARVPCEHPRYRL